MKQVKRTYLYTKYAWMLYATYNDLNVLYGTFIMGCAILLMTYQSSSNTVAGVESNFEVVSTAFATTQGIQYDFRSLMHYDAYAFTSNGQPTIEPLDSANIPLDSLGQREGLSSGDLLHINTLYCEGCKNLCSIIEILFVMNNEVFYTVHYYYYTNTY